VTGTLTAYACRRVAPAALEAGPAGLVLPLPGTPRAHRDCGPPSCPQPFADDLRLVRRTVAGLPPVALRAPCAPDEHARYRWLVGHQAAFAVWQLQARLLRSLADSPAPEPRTTARAALLHDVHSVLFLYTGSCSPQRYAATVRADMTACHPAFSGEWARDHAPLPGLLREVRSRHPGALVDPLTGAARLNRRVHMAVANRLVPNGRSLLQEAGRSAGSERRAPELDLYDAFFGVRRQTVCERFFSAQLLRLLARILCDLSVVPLRSGGMYDAAVERLEGDAVPLLSELAEFLAPK